MSVSLAGLSPVSSSSLTRLSQTISRELAFAIICGATIFAAVLWLPVVLRDPDTLWHITTGDWILAHRAVPIVDTYSYTRAGYPWMAQEWLSEVIMALSYRWGAWNGLLIMTAASAGMVIGSVAYYVRMRVRADVAMMLVPLAAACGGPSLLSRPHVIALPCLAIWTIGLVSARARSVAPPLLLLPVMVIWANLHGSFMVGLVVAGALAVESLGDPAHRGWVSIRQWGVFLIGAVLAAAATPQGGETLMFPFQLMSMRNLYQIMEWKPSDFSHLSGMTGFVLLALYLGLSGSIRLPKFRVLLVAGLLFATMQHVRNAQLFGILVPLLIADGMGQAVTGPFRLMRAVPAWIPSSAVVFAAVVSLFVRLELPYDRPDEGSFAASALEMVPAELRAKPVLNEYGFGGLLIFNGIRPFIDGRADLYGDDFLDMYLSVVRAKGDMLDEVLCRYNIEWTMFGPETPVPALMDRTPGWRRLYSDKTAVIHVRDSQASRQTCSVPARD